MWLVTIGVTLLYIGVGLAHGLEWLLLFPFRTRSKTNYLASKIAFYSLWAFTRPTTSPYFSAFRFHHLSYGLVCMLLFGTPYRFGQWMVFDACVDYNQLGVFNRSYHFVREIRNYTVFESVPLSAANYLPSSEGTLYDVGVCDNFRVYPADKTFTENKQEFLRELMLFKKPKLTDRACGLQNFLIDYLVKPYIESLEPPHPMLKISVDFDLFKC